MTALDSTTNTYHPTKERRIAAGHQPPSSIWNTARRSYRDHRAARAAYVRAQQELSAYTTPADLLELSEVLQRADNHDIAVYRDVVDDLRWRAVRP